MPPAPHTHIGTPIARRLDVHVKQYHIGFLVILNIALLAAYVFLFGFILNKKDMIAEATSRLDVEQLREEQLSVLRNSFRETEQDRNALARYFINKEQLVLFIEKIESVGKRANAFVRFRFVNIREAENILTMEFEAVGSFKELFYFLQLIENLPVRISFEKFLLDKEIPRNFEKRKDSDDWHALISIAVLSFENL